jgi:thioesterase domain-containing protein
VRLLAQVRRRLQCDLPVSTFFAGATVRQMARATLERQESEPAPPSPVILLQPNGTLPPLFCVHSGEGKALDYVSLVRHLGADRPIFGLEDLGEFSRPVTRIASEYVEAIRSVRPDGPYYLVGWSFGGVVAYEMASILERQGQQVGFLGLLDTLEPGLAREWMTDDLDVLIEIGRHVSQRAGQQFSITRAALEPLDEPERIGRLVSALHEYGVPSSMTAEVIRARYETPRARYASARGYVPGRFSGALTLFRATVNNHVDVNPFFAHVGPRRQRTLGWSLVSSQVTVHDVPGEHAELCREPHVRVLVHRMRHVLAEADRAATACSSRGAAPASDLLTTEA